MKGGSDFQRVHFPQQIGPVEDKPTIAQTLSAHVSYQYSTGIVFVCIIFFMFNLKFQLCFVSVSWRILS